MIDAPSTPGRLARSAALALIVATGWPLAADAQAPAPVPAQVQAPSPRPVLNLADGGVIPGDLVDSGQPGRFRWQSDSFLGPFEFPGEALRSIRFPGLEKPTRAVGAFGIKLAGGDLLFGSIVALDGQAAELDVAGLGRVRVDRSRIRQIFRWKDGADLLYNGPNGLLGWREFTPSKSARSDKPSPPAVPQNLLFNANLNVNMNAQPAAKPRPPAPPPGPAWVEDGGPLQASREGVTIQANVGLPARSSIELELSWKTSADFILAMGISDDEKAADRAFRLEVWEGQLVAVRELDKEADLAPIQAVPIGPGRAHLQLYLDQERGRLLVFAEDGRPLADLKLGDGPGPVLPEVRLTNVRGDIRLEQFRVGRWDGETPHPPGAQGSRVQLTDQSMVRGTLDRLDPASREFVVQGESGESRVAEDRVEGIYLARPDDDAPRSVRLAYQDGTRLSGDWSGVEGGRIKLSVPGIAGPLTLPRDGLRGGRRPGLHLQAPGRQGGNGRAPGGRRPEARRPAGQLLRQARRREPGLATPARRPGRHAPARSLGPDRLPDHGDAPAPVGPGRPEGHPAQPGGHPVQRQWGHPGPAIRGPGGGLAPPGDPQGALPPERRHHPGRGHQDRREGRLVPVQPLRPGLRRQRPDQGRRAGGRRTRLDPGEQGQVRAAAHPAQDAARQPPTHLIRSRNGDILRARVVGMDEKTLGIEVRLEEKVIPRDRVSRIIWLHADETDPSKKVAEVPSPDRPARVQAVRSDGIRLTFTPERFESGLLLGSSDVLGPCKVRPQELDQLLIGDSVEKEATQLAYQNFKLQNAAEPKAAIAEAGGSPGGGTEGTEAALVGKPAPDFTLELLGAGGKKFHLAENKGHVVVLDFWATWCGPCLQAMPQIEKVTREFADKGVQLVAVNLQETPAKITAMLDRQKLSPTVALDVDGVVAERYGANAIPQTVVIDRDGKVTRLFIGGGPRLGDQLREALQALMPAPPPAEAPRD